MPKQKFNTTDVAAECAELRRLVVGSWLSNIYDLDDKKTFLLKFSKSGGRTESGEGEKTVLLLESGCRFHTTTYRRERKQDTPSKLNQKLRMHLRGKRLNGVNQLGNDRCVEFVFGAGDTKHSLVLELYAQGNLVLLDANDKILTLLRPVRDDKKRFGAVRKPRVRPDPVSIAKKNHSRRVGKRA
jgi:predicted ribosome quality control (RQC) complex YloA/Tae2 family protein